MPTMSSVGKKMLRALLVRKSALRTVRHACGRPAFRLRTGAPPGAPWLDEIVARGGFQTMAFNALNIVYIVLCVVLIVRSI